MSSFARSGSVPSNGSDTRLKGAQPTIVLAGREDSSLSAGLLDLRIAEHVDGLYACEATFGNWGPVGQDTGFLYFDRQTLDFGKELAVRLGQDQLFRGWITGLRSRFGEGTPPALTVLAEDRLQNLRMTRRTRTFTDMSDADVIRRLASDHSLTPDIDASGPTHKVVAQLEQSDLAFARDRARSIDSEVWVDGTTLFVRTRPSRARTKTKLAYGNGLRELEISADLAQQRTGIDVAGWDVAAKQALKESITDSALGGELGNATSGASVLQQAFGARKETVGTAVPLTGSEARARGQALFRRQARRFVCGRGIAETDARLRVGTTVTFEGVGPLFDGDYYLTECVHRFDRARGQRTELAVERPGLGSGSR
jgi:phage protein D